MLGVLTFDVIMFLLHAEAAEAMFKEVMTSYEAIKTERKNMK